MTNVEKAENIGILEDLKENYTEEEINRMSPKRILRVWLEWEGIIGFTDSIVEVFNTFFKEETK